MGSLERYCGQLDAARLKELCKNRDSAVASVAAEVQRQANRNRTLARPTTASTGQNYSYSVTYTPAVPAPPKKASTSSLTPAARDKELRQIREQWAADQAHLAKLEHLAWRQERLSRVEYYQY
jgi:hypothetical protein